MSGGVPETSLRPGGRLRRRRIVNRLMESLGTLAALLAAVAAGTGAVLATAHFGNWEVAGAALTARGIPLDVVVQRGIMAEHGLAWTLPRLLGTSRALDLLLSGRVVLGEEAVSLGLADRVFAPGELMPKTLEYAKSLAANSSPVAMGTIKRQVYASWESSLEESRVTAIRFWMGHLRGHPDFKEGVGSFLEKRPPHFAPWDPAMPAEPDPLP